MGDRVGVWTVGRGDTGANQISRWNAVAHDQHHASLELPRTELLSSARRVQRPLQRTCTALCPERSPKFRNNTIHDGEICRRQRASCAAGTHRELEAAGRRAPVLPSSRLSSSLFCCTTGRSTYFDGSLSRGVCVWVGGWVAVCAIPMLGRRSTCQWRCAPHRCGFSVLRHRRRVSRVRTALRFFNVPC